MRDYLNHVGAWIELDDAGIAPIERENDDYIMDLIIQSNAFQPVQIRMLNYCRLYLGAVTQSDLTTTNGTYLDNAKLHGHISRMSNKTRWLKIHQARPTETQWRLWRKANLIWSSKKGRLHQYGTTLHSASTTSFKFMKSTRMADKLSRRYVRVSVTKISTQQQPRRKYMKPQMAARRQGMQPQCWS